MQALSASVLRPMSTSTSNEMPSDMPSDIIKDLILPACHQLNVRGVGELLTLRTVNKAFRLSFDPLVYRAAAAAVAHRRALGQNPFGSVNASFILTWDAAGSRSPCRWSSTSAC